ncbi:hypothetical protein CPHO_11485 [Corynebacterium phocae]|uniref:Uncharacterized protein n=1 Tax=Corynebacterium phocae TaxID=161895 RepID=A0A1L7D5G2_9CORY|nr:hypothetical protein CPHO_11485 [Corynebacterium phocae]
MGFLKNFWVVVSHQETKMVSFSILFLRYVRNPSALENPKIASATARQRCGEHPPRARQVAPEN